jgi:hypothetical protein
LHLITLQVLFIDNTILEPKKGILCLLKDGSKLFRMNECIYTCWLCTVTKRCHDAKIFCYVFAKYFGDII